MKKKDLILVGGGGHCSACLDILQLLNLYNVVGIIEKNNFELEKLDNISVFKDQETEKLSKIYRNFLLTIGKIGKSKTREIKYNELSSLDIELVSLISPTAYISTSAEIAKGVNIMHQALININVKIGENTIINSQSLIEARFLYRITLSYFNRCKNKRWGKNRK